MLRRFLHPIHALREAIGRSPRSPQTATTAAPIGLRTTARLVVAIRADGLQLQSLWFGVEQPIRLRFADLMLISEIDAGTGDEVAELCTRVASATSTDPAQLVQLVARLEASTRLVRTVPGESLTVQSPAPVAEGDAPTTEDLDAVPSDLALLTPLVFRLIDGGFEVIDHDGRRIARLAPAELHALAQFAEQTDLEEALRRHVAEAGAHALGRSRVLSMLHRFARHGLAEPRQANAREQIDLSALVGSGTEIGHGNLQATRAVFARQAAEQDRAEQAHEAGTGRRRPKVIPVAFDMGAPAGLGSVVACAKAFEDGRLDDFYDFRLDWVWDDERFDAFTQTPAIYLFSNYMWSHERCIEVSRRIKERSPNSITIHGGPDTPKYEGDLSNYFAAFPHVDIAVRGEGELSTAEALAALMPAFGTESPDLSVLAGISGIAYRDGNRVVRNPDRDRLTDLNILPSAILTGLFDAYMGMPGLLVTIETNRGCPFGCTFCDWGSATASRVRKFDTDRVMAEIEWSSRAQASAVTIADANYGTFPRDVDFARRSAELKMATGFPAGFGGNYAKNTVQHLRTIINVLAEAQVLTLGTLSLQSMDEQTLAVIRRSNIKTEKYDAIAVEMRNANLPLMIELMMGLPGSTLRSFREDLQQCIDRELPVRVNHTVLLVNSPMNEPDYLAAHQIKTSAPVGPGSVPVLISTATYTSEDHSHMEALRLLYLLFENFGVLRLVSRYVRHEIGLTEMEFYDRLRSDVVDPSRWPTLHIVVNLGSGMMAPPISWKLMTDELAEYLVAELGVADDAALRSVLAAQHALLPAHGRAYPCVVDLPHDVVAWAQAMLRTKNAGERSSWTLEVPKLRTLGPGQLRVDDPKGITRRYLGVHRELNVFGVNWELESPLARARLDLDNPRPPTPPRAGSAPACGDDGAAWAGGPTA